jgi:hypothetical protein
MVDWTTSVSRGHVCPGRIACLGGTGTNHARPLTHDLSVSRHLVLHAYDQRLSERNTGGQTDDGMSVAAALPNVTRSAPEAMDITDEGPLEKGFVGLSRVDHVLSLAGTI